jgi:flavin reductase (DIM6/NTAB) family NADH-FMN oxidoreductase RutF
MTEPAKTIDIRSFWQTIGNRAVGAAVVAARGSDGNAGFLALSATHLSASPPLLMVSIDAKTSALAAVRQAQAFSINYLPAGAAQMAAVFSGKTDLKGAARFDPDDWTTLKTGSPILRSAVGAFDCVLEECIERHGTVIAIGRLVDFSSDPDATPLVSFRGRYL